MNGLAITHLKQKKKKKFSIQCSFDGKIRMSSSSEISLIYFKKKLLSVHSNYGHICSRENSFNISLSSELFTVYTIYIPLLKF